MAQAARIDYKSYTLKLVKQKYQYFYLGIAVSVLLSLILSYSFYKFLYPRISLHITTRKSNAKTQKPEKTAYYTVQPGDFLWKIAEDQYGSGFNAYDIAQINNIYDPNSLKEGEKIVIPKVTPGAPTKGDISSIATSQVTFKGLKYVVQPGDYLSQIAEQVYGDGNMMWKIIEANNIPDPYILEPGMELILPR